MKNLIFVTIFIAFLAFVTLSISQDDFLDLSHDSSIKFQEKINVLPQLPSYPFSITGFAVQQESDMIVSDALKIYKASPSTLYVEVKNDYVFSYGYVYSDTDIEEFSFDGNRIENSKWFANVGSTFLDVTQLRSGKHYLIAYSCKELDNGFDCNDGKWLFAAFETNKNRQLDDPYEQIETVNVPSVLK